MKESIFMLLISLFIYILSSKIFKNEINCELLDKKYSIILKGIAIFFVIICHLGGETGSVIFTPLGGIGVAIFLFLSGFGLKKSYMEHGLNDFWKKKFLKIFLPYLISELVFLIFGVFKYASFMDFLLDITLIKTYHPLGWYLTFLLINYLVFYFTFKYVKVNASFTFYCLIVILSLAFFVLKLPLFFEQSFSFALGIYFVNKDYKRIFNWKNMLLFLIIGIVSLGI